MSNKSKFNVGDEVIFRSIRARVTKVYERQYFYGAETPYWMYDIEYAEGGVLDEVMESALSPVDSNGLGEIPKPKRLCECGAWAVNWASENHSYWCPAYRQPALRGEDDTDDR